MHRNPECLRFLSRNKDVCFGHERCRTYYGVWAYPLCDLQNLVHFCIFRERERYRVMAETLNLLFQKREDETFELQVRGSWSGRSVSGSFVPPYTTRQLNMLLKKLNGLESDARELREIGYRLFSALCGAEARKANKHETTEQSV